MESYEYPKHISLIYKNAVEKSFVFIHFFQHSVPIILDTSLSWVLALRNTWDTSFIPPVLTQLHYEIICPLSSTSISWLRLCTFLQVQASHFEGLITTIVGYVLLAMTLILCHVSFHQSPPIPCLHHWHVETKTQNPILLGTGCSLTSMERGRVHFCCARGICVCLCGFSAGVFALFFLNRCVSGTGCFGQVPALQTPPWSLLYRCQGNVYLCISASCFLCDSQCVFFL